MSSNQRSIFVLLGLGILLTVLFLIFGNKDASQRYLWFEHYRSNSKDPYGTLAVHQLLPTYFPNEEFTDIEERFDSLVLTEPGNYVYLGNQLRLDSISIQALIAFVESGNTAMIATNDLPYELIDQLFPGECDEYVWPGFVSELDSTANVRVLYPASQFAHDWIVQVQFEDKILEYDWAYIPASIFCEANIQKENLGELWDYQTNFVRLNYGEGQFLLHSNPILFTNYFLKEPEGLAYTEQVFSHLEEGPILWDNYSIVNSTRRENSWSPNRSFDSEGPLSYILSERSLRWAWYLLLAGVLLFLIFRAKRKQRVIPVIEPNRNTSLDFITNIGRLYFMRPNHRKLALEQMRLFLLHVRSRYHLHGRDADDTFIRQLTVKSGVDRELIESIIQTHKNIKGSPGLSETALIQFHGKLEQFYKKSK
ncbi:MAG: DUF4350 domain-containing protein [Bacteroidetes bacterium]|nr:DUF4350 domain-containing protein [Bacteroidota bacterium]